VTANNTLAYDESGRLFVDDGFAVINDFATGVDKIQLIGSLRDYSFANNTNVIGSSANDLTILGNNESTTIAVILDNINFNEFADMLFI
jgi:hypothetical protein